MVAAALLAKLEVPLIVLEAGAQLQPELRASTFHAPTLDMLDELGAATPLVAEGIVAPCLQYRTSGGGVVAEFDFGVLADVTRHPFRLQCEQFKLTRILHDLLHDRPGFALRFGAAVVDCIDLDDRVVATLATGAEIEGAYLIAADRARSAVRRSAGIAFEGFTWPERFLVLSTPSDLSDLIPGLAPVSYFTEPYGWFFLLRVPGVWRAMFPVPSEVADEMATSAGYARARLRSIDPRAVDLSMNHRTLYRVHQRVAETFRRGRVLLAGDAAHVNNPLGGMGLNGGVHDAVSLAPRLAAVWHGTAPTSELDVYGRQRRGVTVEHVQRQTINNKRNLEACGAEEKRAFYARLTEAASDPAKAHTYLLDASMISSLRRAAEIA